jgi:hypothetical protein
VTDRVLGIRERWAKAKIKKHESDAMEWFIWQILNITVEVEAADS